MATCYVAYEDVLLVVRDGAVVERRDDVDGECVAAHPDVPNRAFVGTFDDGIHRSSDGGATFERVDTDAVAHDAVTAVAVDPTDPDTVWAGTEPSRVYRSTDGGDTWDHREGIADLPSASEWYFPPRPDTHHVRWLEPDPNDPDRVYVGIEAGALLVTPDAGETWTERPPGSRRDNHSLATHPDAPGRVYAAAGDGYAESRDSGESWEHPQSGLDHRYCWSVVPSPADPTDVVCSAARGPGAAHSPPAESYVYRRTNDEGPWERAMTGLPGPEGLLRAVLAPDPDGGVVAATNYGLHRSDDAGASWDPVLSLDGVSEQTVRGMAVV